MMFTVDAVTTSRPDFFSPTAYNILSLPSQPRQMSDLVSFQDLEAAFLDADCLAGEEPSDKGEKIGQE